MEMPRLHPVTAEQRAYRRRAFEALMVQTRAQGEPMVTANGQIFWRWWYPEVRLGTSPLHNINPEQNTEPIRDQIIAQHQRFPERFFYSIYLHDLIDGPGHPPRNGPSVPPPPPPQDPLAAGNQMQVDVGANQNPDDQEDDQPLPVIEVDQEFEAMLAVDDGNVPVPMLYPQYLADPLADPDVQMEVEVQENQNPYEMVNLGDNFQPLMPGLEQPNDQVGQEQLLPIEVDQQLNEILALGDENSAEIAQDLINFLLDDNINDFGQDINEDEEQ